MTQPMPTAVTDPEPGRAARDVLAELAAVADDRPDWQDRGLCAQTDPEAFFPEKGQSTREPKEICNHCEVRGDCLEYALGRDERFGVWGGLSEKERRRLKRTRPSPTVTAPEPPAAGEQRRESAPAPGAGRHVGGAGAAATLPTEPRYGRGHAPQTTKGSTFPERARTSTAPPDEALREAADRPRRARRASGPARPKRTRPATKAVPAPRTPARSETGPEPATGADQPTATVTELRPAPAEQPDQSGAERSDDEAAAAPPAPRRPPDDPVLATVLAAQADQPGATTADPGIVDALAAGEPVEAASDWEIALAVVTGIQRGRTRGQMARRLGEDSRDVAHLYRRWLEAMPLIEAFPDGSPDGTDRQPRAAATSAGGGR